MRKLHSIVWAMAALLFYGCGHSSKPANNVRAEEDTRPPIVLQGTGYQLDLPAYAEDITCVPVSDEQEAQLKRRYDLIAKPLLVTQNGEKHVQLGQAAIVRFAIPQDFPQERYNELVGMLITDNGAEYKIPDYFALREGFVQFKTSHFSIACAGISKDSLRERFIEEVAVNGWGRNMSNQSIEPTWREQLKKFANAHYMGENDLVGIAMREVFADKDIVKIGIDIVNAHDMEDASLEQRIQVASDNMVKLAEAKLLSYFLNKLKEEDAKEGDDKDESKRNKIIGVLEEHFSMENVEKTSTLLGDDPTPEKCYVFACEYIGNYALEKWKGAVEEMVPYIGAVKQTAKAVEIWKKFWAATQMQDLYERYEKLADETGGLLKTDDWNSVSFRVATPKSLHGMTDEQIRAKIEERYLERVEINQRKAELRKYLSIIESTANLNSPVFEQMHFDYVQRLTVIRNLTDRFYDELVDRDGDLVFFDEGHKRVYNNEYAILEQLCYVTNQYLEYYPDREKFYSWLNENGYNYGQLEDEYKKLDELLWTKKNDPDIHIVIGETLGATGHAKYAGHTICLGVNGKPYKDWYRTIPDEDWVHDLGWSTEYPDKDVDIKLSQYEEIGRPNQVLVYASESDFLSGKQPVETVVFVVDTMNRYTKVELNQESQIITEFVFDEDNYYHVSYNHTYYDESVGHSVMVARMPATTPKYALHNALSDVHLRLKNKTDDFTFTTSGEYSETDNSANIELTVNGSVDFEQQTGTCSVMAKVATTDRGTKITAHFNLTGEILVDHDGDDLYLKCSPSGPVRVESVSSEGESSSKKTKGSMSFAFKAVY